jgi:hypothetical protein
VSVIQGHIECGIATERLHVATGRRDTGAAVGSMGVSGHMLLGCEELGRSAFQWRYDWLEPEALSLWNFLSTYLIVAIAFLAADN